MKVTSFVLVLVYITWNGVTGSRERDGLQISMPILNASIQVDSSFIKSASASGSVQISEPIEGKQDDSPTIGGSGSSPIGCLLEKGYCMTANGGDQNKGVVKLDALDGSDAARREECLRKCAAAPLWTGCEMIWQRGDKGCYVHTNPVSRGNGGGDYYCWIRSKCKDPTTATTTTTTTTTPKPAVTVDPCEQCHQHATCNSEDGGSSCKCERGFIGDGLQCTDINECERNPCSELVQCRNFAGSFACGSCPDGYTGNGTTCVQQAVAIWKTDQFIIEEQVLSKNNLITTIDTFLRQFEVTFQFKPKSIHTDWHSIIHFTVGGNVEKYGDRIPGVWMKNGKFHICSAVNGNHNSCFNTKTYNVGRWISVKIRQVKHDGSHKYSIHVDDGSGTVSSYSVINDKAQVFEKVKVYASDPWYPQQPGEIKKFQIYRTIQTFTSSDWSCIKQKGKCLSPSDRVQSNGLIKLDSLDGSDSQRSSTCLNKCLAYPGSTGCEVRWNREDKGCYAHTMDLLGGSGSGSVYCWAFSLCQGAMPMMIGNFENHLYDGTSRKDDWHYVHISYSVSGKYYTWTNVAGRQWKLFRTKRINELRVDKESPYYDKGHTVAKFTSHGVYGPYNQLYKRAGSEFVGAWTVSFSNNNVAAYNFTEDGTMQRDIGKWKGPIVASRNKVFPAEDGWFQTFPGFPERSAMEFMRVIANGNMEVRHFCTSEQHCGGMYKGMPKYCCNGKGFKHRWMLQQQNVCFGAKGSRYGRFYTTYAGKLSAIKLVHKSGSVGCTRSTKSFWGCSHKTTLGIAITNVQNQVLFPRNLPRDGWYQLSPYTIHSPEIIITNPTLNYKVSNIQQLRIWYGEDLLDYLENDNQGTSCVDVYSMITEEIQQTSNDAIPSIGAVFTINEPWNPLFNLRDYSSEPAKRSVEGEGSYFNAYDNLREFLQKELKLILNKTMPNIPSNLYQVSFGQFKNSSNGYTIINSNMAFFGNNDTLKKLFCSDVHKTLSEITKIANYTVLGKFDVKINQGCCLAQKYGDDSFKGQYLFPTALVGEVVSLPCKYSPTVSLTRACVKPLQTEEYGSSKSTWQPPDLTKCHAKSETTMELGVLNVTSYCNSTGSECETSTELSTQLNKIVPDAKKITTPKDLAYIASITSIVVKEFNRTDVQNVTENILQTMGTVIDSEPTYIVAAEDEDTAASSLLKNVELFSEKLGNTLATVNDSITVSKKNIALQVAKVSKKSSNVKITSRLGDSSQVSVGLEGSGNKNDVTKSGFLASLDLSNSSLLNSGDTIVYSQAYLKSTLFVSRAQVQASKEGRAYQNKVQSLILAVSLNTNTTDLRNPVIIKFKKIYNKNQTSYCRFWQFGKGSEPGHWNETGCRRLLKEADDDTLVTCACSHLTNFALLLDVYQTGSNPIALSYITWIGCGISLVGLVLTIIIFSYFRNLRKKLPSKILICLCISLTILLIIFLAGIEKASVDRTSCQVVAGLLQYFLLASFTWMCVAAVNLYQLLVKVFRSGSTAKFFLRASVIAWALPLIVTVITGAVAPEYMGNESICFPQKNAMYFGVLLPIIIILLINFTILIIILVKFARTMPVGDHAEQKQNLCQVRVAFSISVLLGLGWILSLFANQEAEFVFQLLFCIFNSLQGFFIFVLYTFTNESVRKEFSRKLVKNFGGTKNTMSTAASSSSRDDLGKSTSRF